MKSEQFLHLGAWATASAVVAMGAGAVGAVMDLPHLINIMLPIGVLAWGIAIAAVMKHFIESEKEQVIVHPNNPANEPAYTHNMVHNKMTQLRDSVQNSSFSLGQKLR